MIKRIDKSNPDYSLIDTLNEIIDILNKLEKHVIMNVTHIPSNPSLTCTCGLTNIYSCPLHPTFR